MTNLILLIICASGQPVAIVGIGDAARVQKRVESARAVHSGAGDRVLDASQTALGLVGVADPRTPDEAGLTQMLEDARDREARFDTVGANALRAEVLKAFDRCVRPSKSLRRLAATAAHDLAAALLGEGDQEGARAAAREALRRFGDWPLDRARHPPAVIQLFARTSAELAHESKPTIRIDSDTPGNVLVDGSTIGKTDGALTRELPAGIYRVWLVDQEGLLSLPRVIHLTAAGATVTVNTELDRRVQVQPVVALSCQESCARDLQALGERLDVARIIGVFAPGSSGPGGLEVTVGTGKVIDWEGPEGFGHAPDVEALATFPVTREKFSFLYLIPFGVGQFAQDRPIFGGSYAAAEVALLVWHIVAVQRHDSAASVDAHGQEPALRTQRNISAGLFYGSLVAGILEAVIVGLVTGE